MKQDKNMRALVSREEKNEEEHKKKLQKLTQLFTSQQSHTRQGEKKTLSCFLSPKTTKMS